MSITPELNDYVARARASGFSDDAIRQELLKAGWQINDVNAIIPPRIPSPPTPMQSTPQPFVAKTSTVAVAAVRKSHTLFYVTVVLLLIIGGGTYYFLPEIVGVVTKFTEKPIVFPQQNIPVIPVDEMAFWKTYKNEQYGFEVKYPPEDYVTNGNSPYSFPDPYPGYILSIYNKFNYDPSKGPLPRAFLIGTTTMEFQDQFEINLREDSNLEIISKDSFFVGHFRGVKIEWRKIECEGCSDVGLNTTIFVFKDPDIFLIQYNNSNLFEEIFSTFKFISQATSAAP